MVFRVFSISRKSQARAKPQSRSAVLSEMSRVLKPGGRAVLVDLLPHDREEFRRQLGQTRLGFDAKDLELEIQQLSDRIVREQVGGGKTGG